MKLIGVVLVATLTLACQEKAKVVSGGSATPPAPADAAVAVTPKQPDKPPIELPKLSGKPAAKTKTKHTKVELEKLSKLEWTDWARDVRKIDNNFLTVRHTTKARPKISVTVSILPCLKCEPLQVDKWRAQKEALMVTLATELRDRPDTTFEIGESKLGGAPVIYVYQLGQFMGKDESGNMVGAYSNAYILNHNDGLNQIRVVAEYVDDPVATKEALAQAAPRADLERVATSFLDAFAQAWAN